MRVYSAADAVVGLDVDKDSFDKFRWPLAAEFPIPTPIPPMSRMHP